MEFRGMDDTLEIKNTGRHNVSGYKLYSTKSVVIATIFGTPLAGGYLMAKNYERLNNKPNARRTMIYTFLFVVVWSFIAHLVSEDLPSTVFSTSALIAMWQSMKQFQGALLEKHRLSEGAFESSWKAFGISLIFAVAILLLVVVSIEIF